MTYANFMADVGSIRNRPKTWQDMFFPEIHDGAGQLTPVPASSEAASGPKDETPKRTGETMQRAPHRGG